MDTLLTTAYVAGKTSMVLSVFSLTTLGLFEQMTPGCRAFSFGVAAFIASSFNKDFFMSVRG